MNRKALLLVNTGTPDTAAVKDVRRFLSRFLNDGRVIDLPWLSRKMLVNLIIVPFRAPRSAALYRKLWTDEGSPLLANLEKLVAGLQDRVGQDCDVFGAMRYGNPSLEKIFRKVAGEGYDEIIIFPLFPHYASSTTGSVHELVMKLAAGMNVIPSLRFINQYYDNHGFIEAWAENIGRHDPENHDHVLFSYHSLPLRQVERGHPEVTVATCNCTESMPEHGRQCYRAACYETTRLIAARLGLKEGTYSTAFQSRLTGKWLSPFTDQALEKLAAEGKRKVLVAAPSFTADCLETVIEIGDEYRHLFRQAGGEELMMVQSLNDSSLWIDAIVEIAQLGRSTDGNSER
ncbi:MAG: ferrochelatase [Bacteroidales bacterium]|jgi:ferrochelatase|nr:ferrochelatase [Bacteroidales bacterium]